MGSTPYLPKLAVCYIGCSILSEQNSQSSKIRQPEPVSSVLSERYYVVLELINANANDLVLHSCVAFEVISVVTADNH